MKKSEEILEKHIVLNDCIGYLGSDGRLYKAIIDALNEAINYTHSCTELKDKEALTFKEFVKTFIKTTVHNETYFYKNDEFNKIQKVKEIYNKKILNL